MAHLSVPVSANDHIDGFASAPVTLVEYGDYQCPYCAEAHVVVKNLQRDLNRNLRFIFRNFPIKEAHPMALLAAEYAEAAALQNKFWEMHDRIFENQKKLSPETLLKFAEQLQLDTKKLNHDLHSLRVKNKIDDDFSSGARSGVNGTPCFYINEERFNGEASSDELMQAIEAVSKSI
ncbi:MAG: thioredoxin domain-containing protein [Parachlamydiaceae bacterium]|nr:thioredoxin domain-containing protein [Parachlamydiaceae bacterium]